MPASIHEDGIEGGWPISPRSVIDADFIGIGRIGYLVLNP